MNRFLVLMALAAMMGCKPNDANVKTVKERVDAGEIVWFSEPGSKLPNCRTGADWTGIRGTPNAEHERIVLGKQRSLGGPGVRACYRIGSNVLINDLKPAMGSVTIQAIGIARLDFLRQSHLKGRHFESKDEFNAFTGALAKRMDNNPEGYVYIINIAYRNGSAVNEKAIKDGDLTDAYEETTADGKSLDNCNTWTSIDVSMNFIQPIIDGKVGSYFRLGRQNCIAQGAVIELKEKFGPNFPVLAKAKVKKVKRFKVSALAKRHWVIDPSYDFKLIEEFVKTMNVEAKAELMTVMDLEVLPATPGPVQSASGLNAADCPSAINLSRELSNPVRVDQDSARCAHAGNITNVVTHTPGQTLEIPVRVKSRMTDSESSTVVLELERLDETQGDLP